MAAAFPYVNEPLENCVVCLRLQHYFDADGFERSLVGFSIDGYFHAREVGTPYVGLIPDAGGETGSK